ncbi:DcaP family trimeric outer membrane transporter [Acinetobacter sp. YH01012]|uniref:DcaP family trimeric outer membrane transporter n=1 Tax=Acinetobacter sp. YH01012 TaxID=2601028 RepID=UPI0035A198AA
MSGVYFGFVIGTFSQESWSPTNPVRFKVQQAWINFIYSPVKPVDLGIEYINGERETFAGEKFSDDRVGFMARYSF